LLFVSPFRSKFILGCWAVGLYRLITLQRLFARGFLLANPSKACADGRWPYNCRVTGRGVTKLFRCTGRDQGELDQQCMQQPERGSYE